jgi:hypothetical protein
MASLAAYWWLPWLPGVGDGFIVTTTSGRVWRRTRTIRASVSWRPQICSVSGDETV